jgi:hypothetical protein
LKNDGRRQRGHKNFILLFSLPPLKENSPQKTGGEFMGIEFNEKDTENLQRVKDAMAEKAAGKGGMLESGPDAAAAAAFAQLLDAETRRHELVLRNAGKAAELPVPEIATAQRLEETPWTQKVLTEENRPVMAPAAA